MTGPIILIATLLTALISGVFGMAGGLILMGALLLVLPVSGAMVAHGVIQSVANGWRAVLLSRWIAWRVLGVYAIGSAIAATALGLAAVQLDRAWLFIVLGLVPGLVWLPRERLHLDAQRPLHAALCGLLVTGLNTVAGVAGPLLDVFFVRTKLDRRAVVATKAATQVLAHAVKIAYYLLPALTAGALADWPWLLLAAPLAVLGTTLGARLLERLSNAQFRNYTKWIVTGVGLVYVIRGFLLLTG